VESDLLGRVKGKVAFITGAARGQGRSHAIRLASEGADIIALDLCAPVESVSYAMGTRDELEETARLVRAQGRKVFSIVADVRDPEQLESALGEAVLELGGLDIVIANAGIVSYARGHEITEFAWREMIDINLTGVWHTIKVSVPHLMERGAGSIILISSAAGLQGPPNLAHYVATKHGVTGLMRAFANELAPHMIRVNSIHPTQVETPMIMNDEIFRLFRPDLAAPTRADMIPPSVKMNALPVPWVQPEDVANAALFLASEEARYITGAALPVDAGITVKTP
jgi:SDR family mycofactocin-dependent oxidoreductase